MSGFELEVDDVVDVFAGRVVFCQLVGLIDELPWCAVAGTRPARDQTL